MEPPRRQAGESIGKGLGGTPTPIAILATPYGRFHVLDPSTHDAVSAASRACHPWAIVHGLDWALARTLGPS